MQWRQFGRFLRGPGLTNRCFTIYYSMEFTVTGTGSNKVYDH